MTGDREGMRALAEAMLDVGCEAVVAFVGSGLGVVAVADGIGLAEVAAELRQLADSLEVPGRVESIGRVEVPAGGRDDDYTPKAMDRATGFES